VLVQTVKCKRLVLATAQKSAPAKIIARWVLPLSSVHCVLDMNGDACELNLELILQLL
jgi:hypothetical protein